jgi:hypothetical protein
MHLLYGLDEHWFLESLNGIPSTNDCAAKVDQNRLFPETAKLQPGESFTSNARNKWLVTAIMTERFNRSLEIQSHAADLPMLASLLRDYVDEWIDSGYESGVEVPGERRLIPNQKLEQLTAFAKRFPPELFVWESGDTLMKFQRAPEEGWPQYEADRLMLAFFSSDLRHSIAKCLKCGRYFQRSRLQPVYKRGAYCTTHSKAAGVELQRSAETHELLRRAARIWPRWTTRKHPIRAVWVAGEMNAKAGMRGKRITRAWVTRNKEAILKAVSEFNGRSISVQGRKEATK